MALNLQYDLQEMLRGTQGNPNIAYFYTAMASAVAAYGLKNGSEPLIIGSSLISPIGGKLMEILFAQLTGAPITQPTNQLFVEIAICLIIGYLMAQWVDHRVPVGSTEDTPSMKGRYRIAGDWYKAIPAFVLAVLGGMTLFVTLTSGKPSFKVLSGVSISTALLSPMVNAGLLAAADDWHHARYSALMTGINIVGIMLGGFLAHTFLGTGN